MSFAFPGQHKLFCTHDMNQISNNMFKKPSYLSIVSGFIGNNSKFYVNLNLQFVEKNSLIITPKNQYLAISFISFDKILYNHYTL